MATIRKRGVRWQAIVRRGGQARSATFGTKSAAKAWAQRIESDRDFERAFGKQVNQTVRDLFDEYERATRSLKSWGRSKQGSIKLIVRHMGDERLANLTRDRIVQFALARRDEGAGPATVMMDISYLASAMSTLRDLKGWSLDVRAVEEARAALRRQGVASKSGERTRRPTQTEIDALTAYFDRKSSLPMRDLIHFAIASGMRLSEITGLRWADLDRARRLILIRDRKDPRRKAGNDQLVPLLDVTGYDALALILAQPPGALIWPHNPGTVSSIFPRACKALGIEDLHFHDFRREAASRMLQAGVTIQEVAIVTGHKEWRTLQRYATIAAADVARRWSPLFAPTIGPQSDDDKK